ncbi:NADP-dependent oxidoreductase [Chitinophaga oryzae]|uniref:NADP-dependent oxidoreductase n=1 Tax=Chitinophaga oryzae TaxID=2725414 RepID=A0AAE6ZNK5_9BACT|nr:NADP-dependent oxidoreductase [Chitinophaga oryzae]QJB35050.1 NADP-dependent oxidoreductase [Chitinophaga oryzae]QJB41567.1 NADP-dependent oxidoreductase [Chitinophaga oryzae]
MKAIVLEKLDPAAPLAVTETAIPDIAADEVLVKTHALAINPVDIKTLEDYTIVRDGETIRGSAAGVLDGVSPIILGWDIAGVVTAVGSDVTKFKAGDAVFGMVRFPGHGKAYAEYVAAPAAHLAAKPAHVSFEAAAGATLAAVTAWQCLTRHYSVKAGDRVLITAPTGGVGHYAVQMAKHLGAYVIALTSTGNVALAAELGADEVLDYASFDAATAAPLQLDFILDAGGRNDATWFARHLKPGAPLFYLPSGLTKVQQQRYAAQGLNAAFKMVTSEESAIEDIARLLHDGSIVTKIAGVFPFSGMKAAFAAQHKGTAQGKIIIRMPVSA